MRVGKWVLGRGNNHDFGVTDNSALLRVTSSVQNFGDTETKLVGLTKDGVKVWTLEEEIREMKGYLFGFIHTIHGREMLDAHKMAILEDMKLGRR